MTDSELSEKLENFRKAALDFGAALMEAFAPLVEAFKKLTAGVLTFCKFHLLPAWNYLLTHEPTDARYTPTPISLALAEIYYPDAPPRFFALS